MIAGAAAIATACAKLPPDATERADGTILYCPTPYNVRHVLTAVQERCAPEPAQYVGRDACGAESLQEGRVYRCGYDSGYAPLRGERDRSAQGGGNAVQEGDGDG